MNEKEQVWSGWLQITRKGDRLKVPVLLYHSAIAPGSWNVRKTKPQESPHCVERKVAGSIPQVDVAISVFNLAIMFVPCACAHYELLACNNHCNSGSLNDWGLWKFHFRNKGLVPILKITDSGSQSSKQLATG